MAFALGWTPCVGPVLASILIYAGSQATLFQGMLLLGFYSLGMALPFMVVALALRPVARLLRQLSRYLPIISLVSGIILNYNGFAGLFWVTIQFYLRCHHRITPLAPVSLRGSRSWGAGAPLNEPGKCSHRIQLDRTTAVNLYLIQKYYSQLKFYARGAKGNACLW